MPDALLSPAAAMDRMYGWQRPIYDLTRRYYLLGRDRLLDKIEIQPGARVLEVGCGTARNLLRLAKRHPEANFYGLDASEQMLSVARRKLSAHDERSYRVRVTQGLAERLARREMFAIEERFDAILFSYSLSMIPTWQAAIDAAWANLRVGGCLYFVDFWDLAHLPKWLQVVLRAWLAGFHVHHRPELLIRLRELAAANSTEFELEEVFGRYAWIGAIRKK